MTDQVVGILLGVFSVIMLGVLYWGGYSEMKRTTKDISSKH